MLYAIFGVLAIVLDQWTKYWASTNLTEGAAAVEYIPGLISLENVHNKGAAFSFLDNVESAGKIFIILAIVFAALVIIGIATNFISGKFARWCAVFVAAGGIGNAIDRLMYGYVQDMIKLDIFDFPTFNVADIFITVFCLLFILCIIFGGKASKAEADTDYYDELDDDLEDAPAGRRERSSRRSRFADDYDEAEDDEEDEYPPARSRGRRDRREEDFEADGEFEDDDSPAARRRRRNEEMQEKAAKKERRDRYNDEFEQYKVNRDARVGDSGRNERGGRQAEEDPFAAWDRANAAAGRTARDSASETVKPVSRQSAARPERTAEPTVTRQASWSSDDLSEFFGQPSRKQNAPARSEATRSARTSVPEAPARQPRTPAPEVPVRQPRTPAPEAPVRQPRTPAAEAPARPAPQPAAAPASRPQPQPQKSSSDDFSLDDILAEFK